jgi:hypothetical protein
MSIVVLGAVVGLIVLVMALAGSKLAGSHSDRCLDGRCAASDLVLRVHVAHRGMSAFAP